MASEQPRILIVDDDDELRELIAETLSDYGFASMTARNGVEMFKALESETFDIILLDIMMPGADGLSLCRLLRTPNTPYSHIPIIFLTALKDTTDKVVGLEIGGDDYLSKPFQSRELIARVRALLRRSNYEDKRIVAPNGQQERIFIDEEKGDSLLYFGNWKLNVMARHLIDEEGVVVPLSAAEFRLLVLFLERPQQLVTRDNIMDYLAERSLNIYDRSIDAQISRLRAKLKDKGPNPALIRTMRGDGYMLATPVERRSP
jgi:two-component system OmpR family response regulator